MPDKVTYYAVVDDLSSRERPAGSSAEPTLKMGADPMKHLPET